MNFRETKETKVAQYEFIQYRLIANFRFLFERHLE